MSKNPQVFVTKLAREVDSEELRYHFKEFGRIQHVSMKRGFAFVVSIFLLYIQCEHKLTVRNLKMKKMLKRL